MHTLAQLVVGISGEGKPQQCGLGPAQSVVASLVAESKSATLVGNPGCTLEDSRKAAGWHGEVRDSTFNGSVRFHKTQITGWPNFEYVQWACGERRIPSQGGQELLPSPVNLAEATGACFDLGPKKMPLEFLYTPLHILISPGAMFATHANTRTGEDGRVETTERGGREAESSASFFGTSSL
ncbi:hypothetical protein S40285_10199 [Stachybotrys chlorohalonatus IBT 40285]|uniref:Uncharacterized protein n=1 Tax=Stachybotrys chlorohalonatus (strain IBT 40285) TaxID=1283841 RepID=A0A084QQ91_STAC4|nr:hypothetical protein S40285_10199 [Stachybotrys chlorohalonata IBT 40285]